jgi:hypothetical protein
VKKILTVIIICLLCFSTFLTIGVPAVQATVETGWPVSQPNTPRNADDIYIDFENGIEGIEIESTNPNLKFTTTNGLNWRYGDIRTGSYNVYPYGSRAYECRGNIFAWLGVTGNAGRIDFLGGAATYCSILVSTYSGVVIDAYNSDNELISTSGWARSNINTRTFTRLTVDAPTGDYISYVIIHDTGNYWLLDDLCTDAKPAVIPVPGRSIGAHSDRFDLVFVPDTDYGSPADIDTWLPTFIDHINHQIDDRLGAVAPVSGRLDKFNFYYTTMQGVASSKTLPNDLTKISTFADAYVILHTAVRQDSTDGTPPIYTAEGSLALDQGRSFIHESGHGIFGVADEYDGVTRYFQPNPYPNIWDTQADGRTDAAGEYAVPVNGEVLGVGDGAKVQFGPIANGNSPDAANTFFANTDIDNDVDSSDVRVYIDAMGQETNTYGINSGNGIVTFNSAPPTEASVTIDYSYVKDEDWNPIKIQKFTDRSTDWWKLGTTRYIMYSGEWFAINGWGKPAARRIQWFLDQFPDGSGTAAASPQPEKSIWLNLEVSADEFHLIDDSYIIDSPPNYLSGTHDFTAKVFSASGELLGEYGFNDPRRIMAELGYDGPTWLDSTDFQLILPYFNLGARVDLIESATGNFEFSVDISRYVTPYEDVTPPTTILTIGNPYYIDSGSKEYITSVTTLTLTAEDNVGGTGVASTRYRVYNSSGYDTGFLASTAPIEFHLNGIDDGEYSIGFYSVDNIGNVEGTNTQNVILDNNAPLLTVETPAENDALQDGVTFKVSAWDLSAVASVTFSTQCPQGNVISPEFQSMPATLGADGKWSLYFETRQLQDGFYLFVANGTDVLGNWGTTTVPFSIRNWATIELLPSSETNKAGRTMPVKFSIRVKASVDPTQPFIYNQELVIKIYKKASPSNILLQTSTFGTASTDYRIDSDSEKYHTNFKTLSTPATYIVQIYRKGMLIGSFEFKTVK